MTSLQGKIAFVSGAASGIGRTTSIEMARCGATLALTDLNEAGASETIAMIKEIAPDADPLFVRSNLSDEAEVGKLFAQIRDRFGRLDIAANIAGVSGRRDGPVSSPIINYEAADFDFVFAVNARGPWLCMREEMRLMVAQKGGAILNLASVAGKAGVAGSSIYSATKHAVLGMTKCIALEGAASGVRVNAICPGVIATPMADALVGTEGAAREALTAMHPLGRLGTPEEVAQAIIWLCSDEASFITGAALDVDGGYLVP
ncbi:MAG: SDR family oxidoreductase [Gammaproteobacteria bacterium]|nr:SDR family oxidoreductase [Gammaproteobacteria bacterium]